MKGNFHIGTFFDIPVKIHWSFSLLLLFVAYVGFTNGFDLSEFIAFGLYILVLFICVVCHEYGHALMARKYNVKTRDIILSPIGGVARLESIPEEPYKELLIALAGPLVNVVIACLATITVLGLYDGSLFPSDPANLALLKYPSEFIRFVLFLNIALFVFNLLPAFPMDGGRVLRSLLAMVYGRVKATRVATFVGKIMAGIFIIIGIYNNHVFLGIIGVFVYISAGSENKSIMRSSKLKNTKVKDIMNRDFTRIYLSDTVDKIIGIYNLGKEKNFVVLDNFQNVVGSIPEIFIQDFINNHGDRMLPISSLLSHRMGIVKGEISLYDLYGKMQSRGLSIVAIKEDDGVISGVMDRHYLGQHIEKL